MSTIAIIISRDSIELGAKKQLVRHVEFDFLKTVDTKTSFFWDITP
jgi:hypothetical protein